MRFQVWWLLLPNADEFLHVLALDALSCRGMGDCLPVAAVESEGDLFAKPMSLVALTQHICHWSDGVNRRRGMVEIQEFAETEIVTVRAEVRAENPANWLMELSDEDTISSVDG